MFRIINFVLIGLVFFPFSLLAQESEAPPNSNIIEVIDQPESSIQIATEAGIIKIDNGDISLFWNPDEQVLSIDQNGLYAKIVVSNTTSSLILRHQVPGRRGRSVEAVSLILQDVEEEINGVFTISEQSPFVVVSKLFSKEMFKDGPAKKLDFPKIELMLPESVDQLKTLGTAGLRPVDGHKGSYMFLAVANPENRSGIVCGWLTSNKGSGIVHSEKSSEGKAVISPVTEYGKLLEPKDWRNHEENLSELFVIGRFDDCRLGLERYAWQIARTYRIRLKELPAGYCTWYADKFGGACNEKEIENLTKAATEKLAPYGFNFVQIDDLWQSGTSKNGPRKNFTEHDPKGPYPNGMLKTANMIRDHHLKAGIWFMPFSGSSEDPFWNKNWFVKSGVTDQLDGEGKSKRFYPQTVNKQGEPYESFWGGTSLDLTNPDVQKYLFNEVERIAKQWNFNYFKLDGLWTGLGIEQLYVNDEYRPDDLGEAVFYDPSITPLAAYRKGFEIIRQAAEEEVFILGCNVSQNMRMMGGSFGCVDAMRIGPDNGPDWKQLKAGPWHGSNRYFLNGRVWWNDPDPVYVRNSMPLEHARLIASWVAVSGQLFAFSDWLPDLSDERVEILQKTIRPHGLRSARPVDLFNEDLPRIWHLTTRTNRPQSDDSSSVQDRDIVAFFNWNEKETKKIETSAQWIGLPEAKEYVAFDFWGNQFLGPFTDKLSIEIPPTSCVILAVRPVEDHPILLSTSQHVTQGIVDVLEENWDSETKKLSGLSHVVADKPYELRIYDPAKKEIRREIIKSEKTLEDYPWSVSF